ncbi:MAG: pyruvate, phosphate dikinase [Candidatus Peribacteraceae bacterium]|nr:pyruvate, phosphate dikinase [Candidatus Peribacteraceae bacterium]
MPGTTLSRKHVHAVHHKPQSLPSDTLVLFGGDARPVTPDPQLHGGKAASLMTMTKTGLKVPPGCVLTTRMFRLQREDSQHASGLLGRSMRSGIAHIEEATGKQFGFAGTPLLVSVRSGAPVSMPGMMDTILNVGLHDSIIASVAATYGLAFAWGSYLRLIAQMVSLAMDIASPSGELKGCTDLSCPPKDAQEAEERCRKALSILERQGTPFPQDPWEQLSLAVAAVFRSWDSHRCRVYRRLHGISPSLGTACTIQAMIFGNANERSGTGVCFSRDPSTGACRLTGEYLAVGQGEDVVAGIRTPFPLAKKDSHSEQDARMTLEGQLPQVYAELKRTVSELEGKMHDILDIEFTVENGVLYFLQCRSAKRSALCALVSALDFHAEETITAEDVTRRISEQQITQLLKPGFDLEETKRAEESGTRIAVGLPAGPGSAVGRICLDARNAPTDTPWILVRSTTSPEDVPDMVRSVGVLTAHGGMSSHAALVARQMGLVCVTGCEALCIDAAAGHVQIGPVILKEGDWISVDGSTGKVYAGQINRGDAGSAWPLIERTLAVTDALAHMKVEANADTPEQARVARSFGARGIGLTRTEHMFFGFDRLPLIQRLILAEDDHGRAEALKKLEVLQTSDFEGLLSVMDGLPVTVRTIDPPLHEFLPKAGDIAQTAERLKISPARIRRRIAELKEENPMLGLRGCRLGILYPAIPLMQVRSLLRAACALKLRGADPHPQIMIPLTSGPQELHVHRTALQEEIRRVCDASGANVECPIGTMIEVPRAALLAGKLAEAADFFSFGTNDLTQMVYALSRDDAFSFLPEYLKKGIYPSDPFASLDQEGVGLLMEMAVKEARSVKPQMKIGICGEHGGDPASIAFCARIGLDYVSCSPFRVPIARLAAAKAGGK